MQPFKEIPYQNFIELRFTNRNLNHLNAQQTLLKYKRNASILSKIFSFERDPEQPTQPKKEQQLPMLTQQYIQKCRTQVEQQQQTLQNKVNQNIASRQLFQSLLSQSYKINSKQQFYELIGKLKTSNLYDDTHPYLVQSSPFYMNSTNSQVLQVVLKNQQQQSYFNESDLLFEQLN